MKRTLYLIAILAMSTIQAIASPVTVSQARQIGLSFIQSNAQSKSRANELTLAYTQLTKNDVPALYVFNHDGGFVIVAADDVANPILAWSDEGSIDVSDMPDGLSYYLGFYARQISFAIEKNLAPESDVMLQWEQLRNGKGIESLKNENVVPPLLSTNWNQDYPYNYYCPTASGGPGGKCYAGCVATSMSQVMRYWSWPETGNGQHSYSTSSYGGTLSANFGETTYNWTNMPNTISNNSPQAIALLMYHCGIAVNMNYSPNGSGAHTEEVPSAITKYFRYGSCANIKSRDNYPKTVWEDMLISSFDRGLPMVYSGSDVNANAGHAFNCDGYDAQRRFHFNWGWSGAGNGYFAIDALNLPYYLGGDQFNTGQRAVFDMMPDYVYNSIVPAIDPLEINVANAMTKTSTLSWTNPSVSVSGVNLQAIERIILKRNGTIIQTFNNVQPGAEMVYEDQVPEHGFYEYTIYGINNNVNGEPFTKGVVYGPNCTWKMVCTTSNFQGWNEGSVQVIGRNGTTIKRVTMTSSTPVSERFQLPEGDYSLVWDAPSSTVNNLTISLKNSANQQVYSFSGSSNQLNGTLFSGNNDCDGCQPPTNLNGRYQWSDNGFGTLLTWDYEDEPQSFKVYRSVNGIEYEEIATVDKTLHEYFDMVEAGEYYYQLRAYRSYCESTPAWASDNLDYVHLQVTSVSEIEEGRLSVYPNPANHMLSIEAEEMEQVIIRNTLGQVVLNRPCADRGIVVNTSAFSPGIYTVSVKTPKGLLTNRFSVIH